MSSEWDLGYLRQQFFGYNEYANLTAFLEAGVNAEDLLDHVVNHPGGGAVDPENLATSTDGAMFVTASQGRVNAILTEDCTVDVVWPDDDTEVTVAFKQGASGGYTPTFVGVTWMTPKQPRWSRMPSGEHEEIRFWTVDGVVYAEWVGYSASEIPKIRSKAYVGGNHGYPSGSVIYPPFNSRGTVSAVLHDIRFVPWSFDEEVTVHRWGFIVSAIDAATGTTDTLATWARASLWTPDPDYGYPRYLFHQFEENSFSSGITSTGANIKTLSTDVVIPPGQYFIGLDLRSKGAVNELTLRQLNVPTHTYIHGTYGGSNKAAWDEIFDNTTIGCWAMRTIRQATTSSGGSATTIVFAAGTLNADDVGGLIQTGSTAWRDIVAVSADGSTATVDSGSTIGSANACNIVPGKLPAEISRYTGTTTLYNGTLLTSQNYAYGYVGARGINPYAVPLELA